MYSVVAGARIAISHPEKFAPPFNFTVSAIRIVKNWTKRLGSSLPESGSKPWFAPAQIFFPYTVRIILDDGPKYSHNHPTKSLQSLSFKDIPEHVSKEIRELFEKGYTPGLAYQSIVWGFEEGYRSNDLPEMEMAWR